MTFLEHDHRGGFKQVSADCLSSITTILADTTFTKRNQSVPKIRQTLLASIYAAGWSEEAKLDPSSSITITSVRSSVGLCFQTGNMARIYADLLKLQLLFHRGKIAAALFL